MKRLAVLSAGAAQGVVTALAAEHGIALEGSFGAVGAMKEKLLAGAPCELIVLSRALIDELVAAGRVSSSGDLGTVRTGVAVREGDPVPDISGEEGLRAALLAAEEIFFPDPVKATAGIHLAKILERLGIRDQVAARLRPHPNGATAMREMAARQAGRVIGCTQVTEIRNTPGAKLVGALPARFELATVYTAALTPEGTRSTAARTLLAALCGEPSKDLRRKAGFDL
jgi:molybdate transport system substrate-binding protein